MILAIVPIWGCGTEEMSAVPIRPVLSIVVADAQAFQGRRFAGTARGIQEANLAFEVSGRLTEFPVAVGSEVVRGQVVARLDSSDFQAELKSAEAELKRDVSNYRRGKELFAGDVIAEAELDRLEARREIAVAHVDLTRKALNDSVLRAPFAGTISATFVENHENVVAKEQVVRLLDTSMIEMVINIPESLITSVTYVRDLRVRFDAFRDVEIPALISEVSNEASATTRTYPVTLEMRPPKGVDILPGMAGEATGRLELPGDLQQSGIEVPVAAVFADDGSDSAQSFVWIVDEQSKRVSRREVEFLGFRERGVLVQGIEPGERIAIAGVHTLREGQLVRIAD